MAVQFGRPPGMGSSSQKKDEYKPKVKTPLKRGDKGWDVFMKGGTADERPAATRGMQTSMQARTADYEKLVGKTAKTGSGIGPGKVQASRVSAANLQAATNARRELEAAYLQDVPVWQDPSDPTTWGTGVTPTTFAPSAEVAKGVDKTNWVIDPITGELVPRTHSQAEILALEEQFKASRVEYAGLSDDEFQRIKAEGDAARRNSIAAGGLGEDLNPYLVKARTDYMADDTGEITGIPENMEEARMAQSWLKWAREDVAGIHWQEGYDEKLPEELGGKGGGTKFTPGKWVRTVVDKNGEKVTLDITQEDLARMELIEDVETEISEIRKGNLA